MRSIYDGSMGQRFHSLADQIWRHQTPITQSQPSRRALLTRQTILAVGTWKELPHVWTRPSRQSRCQWASRTLTAPAGPMPPGRKETGCVVVSYRVPTTDRLGEGRPSSPKRLNVASLASPSSGGTNAGDLVTARPSGRTAPHAIESRRCDDELC